MLGLTLGSPDLDSFYDLLFCLEITEFGNLPNGVVLTLGMGEMGELGMGSEVMSLEKPMIVEEFGDGRIKKIVAGAQHTICLSCDNEVSFNVQSANKTARKLFIWYPAI